MNAIPPRRSIIRLLSICALLCAVLCGAPQEAKALRKLIDSHGRDFWLTFLPNFHNYKSSNGLGSDSLYIFVAATEPTSGMITYRNRNGQEFQQAFTINDPAQIYSFRVRDGSFELEGFNNSGVFVSSGGQGERIAPQSFHVTADADVTVYALSQANRTSDAFLVLPTDAVGKDYFVMAYASDPIFSDEFEQSTPSQFAVVATEDNTEITITPRAPTFRNRDAVQEVTLMKGDCYLVQAYMGQQRDQDNDLTGTRVESNKPIAVFTGHQRARVPQSGDKVSRDVLIEQMPPVGTWGLSAFITPYRQPIGTTLARVQDRYRVLAAFDNTQVFIDGSQVATLSAGGFYEAVVNRPMHLTASAPVLVAQFKESALDDFGSGSQTGDPFLMIIPPSEQFLSEYRFISVQASAGGGGITYLEQYVNIVAPDSKLASVLLDGAPVGAGAFTAIPASGYSYVSLPVRDGVHTVRADSGVGVYVYGYGDANSYGYIGGTNYSPVDFKAPRINIHDVCFGVDGWLVDDLPSDFHIERVDILDRQNVQVSTVPTSNLQDSIRLVGQLISEYLDGSFTVSVLDSSGLRSDTIIAIPGFTVRSALTPSNTDLPINSYNVEVGSSTCATYELVNTGRYPQTITSAAFLHSTPGFTVQTLLPITIPPGATTTITLCFAPQKRGVLRDTLVIADTCFERNTLAFSVVTGRAKMTLQVLDASANPGRTTDIKIKVLSADGLDWSGVEQVRCVLQYDASMLAYRGKADSNNSAINGKVGRITVDVPITLTTDSVIASLRFYAGLAKDSISYLILDTAYSLDGASEIQRLPGTFRLTGICYEGGVRLLNPSGKIAIAPPRPNPASDVAEIDIETVEAGRTFVEVVDALGRTVAVPFDGELTPGLHVISFGVGQLGAGMYHLVLRTPTEIVVQRLEVVR